jgi:hypothetical protein
MLDMAGATPADYLIDLGSGDGRTVITAAKRGIKALGVEYNPQMVELSRAAAAAAGVADKATFVHGDIFETDFSQADVLTLFLLDTLNMRLRPTILSMKPGTRVVSNTFKMGDWTPDQTIEAGGDCTSYCTAHKWTVPAKVGGTWRLPDGELTLTQRYQMVTGSMSAGGTQTPITEGRLNGANSPSWLAGSASRASLAGRVLRRLPRMAANRSGSVCSTTGEPARGRAKCSRGRRGKSVPPRALKQPRRG